MDKSTRSLGRSLIEAMSLMFFCVCYVGLAGCGKKQDFSEQALNVEKAAIPSLDSFSEIYSRVFEETSDNETWSIIIKSYNSPDKPETIVGTFEDSKLPRNKIAKREDGSFVYETDMKHGAIFKLTIANGQWEKTKLLPRLNKSRSGSAIQLHLSFQK